MKNLVRKTFLADDTWIAPAGVKRLSVESYFLDTIQDLALGENGNVGSMLDASLNGYSWGDNTTGQLGANIVGVVGSARSSPVLMSGSLKWKMISNGAFHGLGISSDGDLYAWGLNSNGSLGDGTVVAKSSPVLVSGGKKWRYCSAGNGTNDGHSAGIDVDGNAYCWGSGGNGQLGDGTIISKSSPVLVSGGIKWKNITTGQNFTAGVATTGDAYGWGSDSGGKLGGGALADKSTPSLVVGSKNWKEVAAGSNHVLGVTTGSDAYAWGLNTAGQLGDGSFISKSSPVLVLGSKKWARALGGAQTSYGLEKDTGDAYGWGLNTNGQIGDGSVVPKSSPVLVTGGNKWKNIAPGSVNGFGLRVDGSVMGWGANSHGQIGDNSIVPKSSPVLVVGAINWKMVEQFSRAFIDVVPGQSYSITTLAATATFGLTPLEKYWVGKVVLEYFA